MSGQIPQLETPRLILRPLVLEDAEQTQPLFAQWDIVKHLAAIVPWPYPPDGGRTFYKDVAIPAMERGEAWHWTIRLKSNPTQIIGAISLQTTGDSDRGFWLGIPWQGRGYMTEASEATFDFWFNTLGQPRLRTFKAAENIGSRRISEKSGMRMIAVEERDFVAGRLLAEVWEITAEEWRAARRSA